MLGGDIKSAITGAAFGAAFGYIGARDWGNSQKIYAHGVTGGAQAEVSGGKFKHGFLSAGFTKWASPSIEGVVGNRLTTPQVMGRTFMAAAIGGTASALGGGKFANGAVTGAFSRLFNAEGEKALAQKSNPARGVADRVLDDEHLTLGEANEVWRANNDPNFEVTVDASQLTVQQTGDFRANGTAPGRIPYSDTGDWVVHGSVTLHRNADGVISILPGQYDFQPHTPVRSITTVIRNVETYGGFYVGSRAGTSVGTDYLINYSGSPNVVR